MELLVGAFVAGLAGGVHCIGMCGGIAGTLGGTAGRMRDDSPHDPVGVMQRHTFRVQVAGRHNGMPHWRRQLAFNAGRLGSYAIAGGIAGALGSAITLGGAIEAGRTAGYIAAQTMLVLLGLYIAGWTTVFPRFEAAGGALWRRIEPLRRRCLPVDTTPKAIAAGAVWGWVPCGLVYGMLPFAVAGAGTVKGALMLVAFGLGTLPWLLAAGTLGARLARLRQRTVVRRAAGLFLVVLAIGSVVQLMHVHAH